MKAKLTKSIIEAAQPREQCFFINDTKVPGFRIRIHPSGKKT